MTDRSSFARLDGSSLVTDSVTTTGLSAARIAVGKQDTVIEQASGDQGKEQSGGHRSADITAADQSHGQKGALQREARDTASQGHRAQHNVAREEYVRERLMESLQRFVAFLA